MQYKTINLPAFNFIGISLRTSNADPKAMQSADGGIGAHWQKFYSEKIAEVERYISVK
jgi:predicted transcriptional regulator YdeE